MSASNSRAFVLDYDAGGTQLLCLSDSSLGLRLLAYPSKAMPGKRQVSFFHVGHPQQMVERIATKASDAYYQPPSRWPSSLFFLQE
ncbi:conserved protein of unknown function [Candidatus Nitrotoga arctica]|uniref:Uncharacterized protein n=1 Tax=Candidatus Nitrotoga arctica TaxID=453162 RepID=A0ABN8ANJ9_9PROT|nr:conserved protein of unknown function [Candidatus Nitrotoga arctica]